MKHQKRLRHKKIVITGSSSGIGKAAAIQLSEMGAEVLLIARREDELKSIVGQIQSAGGLASAYPCDLSNLEIVDQLCDKLLTKHQKIDILINNAGRSIRRPTIQSIERYHDFERCMTLNFYSPVRLIRKLLPPMLEAKDGHIINSSTWGTLFPNLGFGLYNASKAALDSFAQTLRLELHDTGVAVTQIHYPLVHTPMSAPTEMLRRLPGLTPEMAGKWMVKAVLKRPHQILDTKTRIVRMFSFLYPTTVETISCRIDKLISR